MSKTEAHGKTPPPPLDEYGNPIAGDDASIADTSTNPTVEELMKKLDKLNVELTKLKAKDKKGKKHASASEDDDSSYEEEVSNKAKETRKKTISPPIMLCLSITITCLVLRLTLSYPLARPHF
jgi:hypothetical protein